MFPIIIKLQHFYLLFYMFMFLACVLVPHLLGSLGIITITLRNQCPLSFTQQWPPLLCSFPYSVLVLFIAHVQLAFHAASLSLQLVFQLSLLCCSINHTILFLLWLLFSFHLSCSVCLSKFFHIFVLLVWIFGTSLIYGK